MAQTVVLLYWKLFLIFSIPFLDFKSAAFVVLFNQDLFQFTAAMTDFQQNTKQIIQNIKTDRGTVCDLQWCWAKLLA